MIRRTAMLVMVATIALAFSAEQAYAWGPRAQQVITSMALQLVRKEFSTALMSLNGNYDSDLLRGALAGSDALAERMPVTDDKEAALAIATEIQLLRAVRKYGIGSYYFYRMGLLSALISDTLLPYGLGYTPADKALKKQIEADIDAHLDTYTYSQTQRDRRYVRSPQEYFPEKRAFLADAASLIAGDYSAGLGYDGYLKHGGEALLNGAIEAVADVWYTILGPTRKQDDVLPSPEAVTNYLVNNIAYLLKVKGNREQAERTYRYLVAVNPGIVDAYERVGDLFYEFGLKERGVTEWRTALSFSSPTRQRVVKKLASHYLEMGKESLGDAELDVKRRDDALQAAQEAFRQALEYERTNQEAADFLAKTRETIRDREERRELNVGVMAAAESVWKEAERSKLKEDYGNALMKYNFAKSLLENVDPEFPELKTASQGRIAEAKKEVTRLVNKLLEKAQEAISDGDRSLDADKFDTAIEHYGRVDVLLGQIPASEETGTYSQEKLRLSKRAEERTQTAQIEKRRWTQLQQQQERQAREQQQQPQE